MAQKLFWSLHATVPSRFRHHLPLPPANAFAPARSDYSPLWSLLWLGIGVGLGTFLALIALALGLVAYLYNGPMIMPGVRVMGLEVGGYTREEAATLLVQQWQLQTLMVQSGQQNVTLRPDELGLSLDSAATVEAAYRQGRSFIMLREWWRQGQRVDLQPVWRFEPTIAQTTLQTIAPQFSHDPTNATIQQVNGRVEIVPATVGQTVNVEATVAQLRQNLASIMADKTLPLVMLAVQPAVSDVSAAVAQANLLLNQTLTLQGYDPIKDEQVTWTASPATWLTFSLEPKPNAPLQWQINREAVSAYLATQNQTLGENRYVEVEATATAIEQALQHGEKTVSLRIAHAPQTYTVQYGETLSSIAYKFGFPYPWLEQVNPNISSNLAVGQVINIPSVDVLLPLPVIENKRIVVSISQQKMWVYENGQEKWAWLASTGIASSPTSPGIFQIQTHEENAYAPNWNLWMPNFMGIYKAAPYADFMNGIHGFPSRSGSQILWTRNLGHPITYGCVLISSDNAAELFKWAEAGVVVEIQP